MLQARSLKKILGMPESFVHHPFAQNSPCVLRTTCFSTDASTRHFAPNGQYFTVVNIFFSNDSSSFNMFLLSFRIHHEGRTSKQEPKFSKSDGNPFDDK